jgi:hypothetical protein
MFATVFYSNGGSLYRYIKTAEKGLIMQMRLVVLAVASTLGVLVLQRPLIASAQDVMSFLEVANTERQSAGLPEFEQNSELLQSAELKATYLCEQDTTDSVVVDTSWDFQTTSEVRYTALAEVKGRAFTTEEAFTHQVIEDSTQYGLITSPHLQEIGIARYFCAQNQAYYDVVRYGTTQKLDYGLQQNTSDKKDRLHIGAWVVNKNTPVIEPTSEPAESNMESLVSGTKEIAYVFGQALSTLQECVDDECMLAPEVTRVPKKPTKPVGLTD